MKKKNNKKNTRKVSRKENKLKQKILEINLSKATIITSIIVIIAIALITAKIIKTINESSKEKVETEEGEEYSPVNWIESTEIEEDGNYKKVPVPKGYVASQIEGETTDPEEPEVPTAEQLTKKNIFELQKNVNQYVWVPVTDINRICGVDANGKLWGKLYNFNNSGSTPLNWTETEGNMGITSKTNYREPDVTHYNINYDIDKRMKNSMYGETQYEMLTREMEQNFYETMKSIEKYGGYYIGRYETGNLKEKTGAGVIRKMQDNNSINNANWYQMYKKCDDIAKENENIKTSMIWGSLWDEMLKWLVESGAKTSTGNTITYSLVGSNS